MQSHSAWHRRNRPRIQLEHKLLLSHIAVSLCAALTTAGLIALRQALQSAGDWPRLPARGLAALVIVLAIGQGLLISMWVGRALTRRLRRAAQVCQAWLRGNLVQRIADPATDELGSLSEQLDLLAEHLEQDEQDLNELRAYSTRLSDQVRALAVDEERERLARELHDGVKQHLFSLSMTASAIRTHMEAQAALGPELQEMVQDLEATSKTVQRELTRLIENLRPGSLEEKGLAAALNDYTLLFGAREHILAYLDVQGNDALLGPTVAESLYRVAQEALHNVARHARATRVDIRLRCLPEQATLVLRDNGAGFDTTQARRGLGLGNMQDRMMAIGGRLTLKSEIGVGTQVRAEVGLTQPVSMQSGASPPVKDRPEPDIKNWAWLGQRLVIPVGQTWPWLPADQAHLQSPLIEPEDHPLLVWSRPGLMGIGRHYQIESLSGSGLSIRVDAHRSGYQWRWDRAAWALQHVRAPSGVLRAVLTRNRQPVAALQSQGRLLNRWTEFVYDGRGYRLLPTRDPPGEHERCPQASVQLAPPRNSSRKQTLARYILQDRAQEPLLTVEQGSQVRAELCRALPLPLLVAVLMQTIEQEPLQITRKEEPE